MGRIAAWLFFSTVRNGTCPPSIGTRMNLPPSSSSSAREPDYLQFRAVDCAGHSWPAGHRLAISKTPAGRLLDSRFDCRNRLARSRRDLNFLSWRKSGLAPVSWPAAMIHFDFRRLKFFLRSQGVKFNRHRRTAKRGQIRAVQSHCQKTDCDCA